MKPTYLADTAPQNGRHLDATVTLLPGENSPQFRQRREKLFRTHDPRTVDEAYCVEMIAKMQWGVERALRWQEVYNAQQDGLLTGDPGRYSPICESDGHRSLHRPMDCQVQIDRMDRTLARNRSELRKLQTQRRLGLLPGTEEIAESYRVFLDVGIDRAEVEAEPVALEPLASVPVTSAPLAPAASDSQDSGIEKRDELAPRVPTRVSTRGRLIGGFGRRRIFAEALKT